MGYYSSLVVLNDSNYSAPAPDPSGSILVNSSGFDAPSWVKSSGMLVVADDTASSDGSMTADKIIPGSSGWQEVFQIPSPQPARSVGDKWVGIIEVKPGNFRYFVFAIGTGVSCYVIFDTLTLSTGDSSGVKATITSSSIVPVSNGFYKLQIKCTISDPSIVLDCDFYANSSISGPNSVAGNGTSAFWVSRAFLYKE